MTDSDTFTTYLLASKASANLACVRERVLAGDALADAHVLQKYQEQYGQAEFEASRAQHDSLTELRRQYTEKERKVRTRRYSIDFDSAQEALGEAEVLPAHGKDTLASAVGVSREGEVQELRERLLGRRGKDGLAPGESATHDSVERQIEEQDNVQSDLVENMSKLVSSLKQGAVAFQGALEEDQKVLGAAEIGIQVASRGLVDVSGKLGRYDKKKLGYLFYIGAFAFMAVGLIITFIVIRLFPAL
ncbi:SNAP receptor [Maudiozyma humilis]|uniref:SNAP receptor n=1 Tax=Maudiozyma humilis TaxID=51915 RepID=A0AAV5RSK6_MAUHU|nr:hypothetical protein DAKH74_011120 [Kazachstania humilis]GMM55134.1 SNAP receptor [Kazachstania humilis]